MMDFNLKEITYMAYIVFLVMLTNSISEAFVVGKEGNYAVLRGTTLTLQCIPRGSRQLADAETAYVWTDESGRDLVDARYTRKDDGDLEIVNVHVGDSGVFKCKVRPPVGQRGGVYNVYEHKLIVYELAGHKFVTSVVVDLSKYSLEIILTILNDLMAGICGEDLCAPGNIRAKECETPDANQERCEFLVPYEGINEIADEDCDEDCVRQKMFTSLKKAETMLMNEFLKMADDPRARLKPLPRKIETKHLVTCRAGFHLVKSFFKRCFPCLPGYYSKPNSEKCSLCNIGSYQDKYGRHDCEKCDESKTTNTMGAKSTDECVSSENTGILTNIKEGIVSLFG